MNDIDHPNVIKLFEIYDEPKKMHLVMELVTGGELFDRIVAKGSYTERDAANCIGTLAKALGHLHSKNIVHRDLKPENILYASPAEDAPIKVADFGLARVVSGKDLMKTACGTPGAAHTRGVHACALLASGGPARRPQPHASAGSPLRIATDPLRRVRGAGDPEEPGLRLGRGRHVVGGRHPVHPALRLPALLRGGAARALRSDPARAVRCVPLPPPLHPAARRSAA
jgi:hypothetical protein